MKKHSFCLVRRRTVPWPTAWGWLVLIVAVTASGRASLPALHRILSAHRPLGGGVLVVEGWIPDSALAEVIARFESGRYETIFTVGGPIPVGARLTPHATFADLTAARLIEEGLSPESIVSIPSSNAERDRTLASARALRRHVQSGGRIGTGMDIVTVGTHARRTWILFRRELSAWGPVGIISVPPDLYDPAAWWRSSMGFRSVVYEMLACGYTWIFRTCQPES